MNGDAISAKEVFFLTISVQRDGVCVVNKVTIQLPIAKLLNGSLILFSVYNFLSVVPHSLRLWEK